MLGLIASIMFILLFLLTGSVVMPLKALVLNVLSLTAAFGAMVWIFQDGHLGAFGTTPSGILVANIPVLLFCIAFGLSMDYEVFLVSRIREFWLASGAADNDESGPGIARTGRVITAAALIMSISFAALIASNVSFMRMFGLGLTLAVLVDATLVRWFWCRHSCTSSDDGTGGLPRPWSACTSISGSTTVTPSRYPSKGWTRAQPTNNAIPNSPMGWR